MSGKRIGERLSCMVPLSGHDIEEILSEQGSTGRRFGDIALQFGLCSPEDVWRAWTIQLAESPQRVNLDQFAIDGQAVGLLSREVVTRYHVMPIRTIGEILVLAVDEAAYPQIKVELSSVLNGAETLYVLSHHQQIARAIRSYYPQANAA